jgi:hypothetical protein
MRLESFHWRLSLLQEIDFVAKVAKLWYNIGVDPPKTVFWADADEAAANCQETMS